MVAAPGPILSHNFDSGPVVGHELVPTLIQGSDSSSSSGSHVYSAPAQSLTLLCPSQFVTLGPAGSNFGSGPCLGCDWCQIELLTSAL